MNERIRELMRQATEYKSNGDDTESPVLNPEKFAELIARDFAHYVDLIYGCPHGDFYAIEYVDLYFNENPNDPMSELRWAIIEQLKEKG